MKEDSPDVASYNIVQSPRRQLLARGSIQPRISGLHGGNPLGVVCEEFLAQLAHCSQADGRLGCPAQSEGPPAFGHDLEKGAFQRRPDCTELSHEGSH
jgi:hypothetical protein